MENFIGCKSSEEGMLSHGYTSCAGCGAALAMRYTLEVLGKETIVVIAAGCWSVIAGPFPYSALKVPVFHTAFETAASVAAGVRAGLMRQGDTNTNVLAWAGDGGTFDIGMQALSGVVERNEDIIYVCYDNEAYMNTGIQRSSSTPWGAWTTTTPGDCTKSRPKKNMVEILAAHRIPYAATASIAYPRDLMEKVRKAKEKNGTRFIHIFTPCPAGWKSHPEHTIKLARLGVETRIFPLYEVEGGIIYRINKIPKGTPVIEYLKLQGRFRHLLERDVEYIQRNVDTEWERLREKVRVSSKIT